MKRNFEKELINYFLTSGHYRVYELAENNKGETIWMIQGSQGQVDEMSIFTDAVNFEFARDKFEQHINKSYVGSKGIAANFIILSTAEETVIDKESAIVSSNYIVSTSMAQIDVDRLKIVNYAGYSSVLQGVFAFVQYKEKQKAASQKSKLTITNGLILINIIMFLITAAASRSIIDIDSLVLLNFGAKYSPLIALGEYHRLVTSMFLHGGIMHIALNMYALKMLGPLIEEVYGKAKFTIIYFTAGITGSVLSYLLSDSLSVGASGAIFGLLGASVVYGIKMKNRIGKDFLRNMFQAIFINLVIGFTIRNIDNAAHIGGLIGGLLITAALQASTEVK